MLCWSCSVPQPSQTFFLEVVCVDPAPERMFLVPQAEGYREGAGAFIDQSSALRGSGWPSRSTLWPGAGHERGFLPTPQCLWPPGGSGIPVTIWRDSCDLVPWPGRPVANRCFRRPRQAANRDSKSSSAVVTQWPQGISAGHVTLLLVVTQPAGPEAQPQPH